MEKPRALIVDDEADLRELVELTLSRMGLAVSSAANVAEAVGLLSRINFDLCFTDMRLPDGSGLELVAHINRHHPDLPVAMITAYGSVDAAVQALKAGAFDFLSKPVDIAVLRSLANTALKLRGERRSVAVPVGRLYGDSPAMQRVRATIQKLARSQAPVFISGESGVGKELAARSIHELGPRAAGPFIPVNCGAIPTELMESEFFGHRKGSFTGAHADKEGLFQAAAGGTLFLDEVAELPMHMQVKLLRVLQEKTVRPIGARDELRVDVRILSATHKDLGKLVDAGQFRQDLYYRINVIELPMPPLRERREDIMLLANRFLDRLAPDWGISKPRLSADAADALRAYDFPGNVRELENILERAVALCENDTIEEDDLQLKARFAPGPVVQGGASEDVERGRTEADPRRSPTQVGLVEYIDTLEREVLVKALEECRYNKTAAARKLGITFRALRYRLKKLGID
jgi:two-component system response regulator PilR (NtrC family)